MPAGAIEDIHWGCVKQEREQGYDVARMAALIAGFPIEVGGATVNRNGRLLMPAFRRHTCRLPSVFSAGG